LDNYRVQAALKQLPEDERNGIIQGSKPQVDPIESMLESCGLSTLEPGASLTAIEQALRTLALNLTDSDDLRRATIREAAIKRVSDIGVSESAKLIDAALQSACSTPSEAAGIMLFTDPDPWPATVDGAKLLDDIVSLIRRFVIVSVEAANATALWILHAWTLEASDISPLLVITSATKRCGKTTLLDALGMLVPRPLPASNITAGPCSVRWRNSSR
jgi:hypothetical protein